MRRMASLASQRQKHADELASKQVLPIFPSAQLGAVRNVSILPLIDFYAEAPSLHTEPGVSYLSALTTPRS